MLRRSWIIATYPGLKIGEGSNISASIQLRATGGGRILIGSDCQIARGVNFHAQGADIVLGDRTFIGPYCSLSAKSGILIGADTLIAERVTIRDQNHRIHGDPAVTIAAAGFETSSIEICDGAWIAAGAVLLKGVRIGRGAVVAANAVVTRDVSDFEIVAGIPAAHIGTRNSIDD